MTSDDAAGTRRILRPDVHAVVLAAAALIAASPWLPGPVRATVCLGCALLAPGQAIMLVAGFRTDLSLSLDMASKVVLSFAFWSTLVLVYGGVGLPIRSPGLQLSMAAIIATLTLIAARRRRGTPARTTLRTAARHGLAGTAVVFGTTAVVLVGITLASPAPEDPGITMSLSGAWSPDVLLRQGYVEVQVSNAGPDSVRGDLTTAVAGRTVGRQTVDVSPGRTVILRSPLQPSARGQLTISLIRRDGAPALRPLTAWLTATGKASK